MKTIKDIFNKESKIFVICQPGFEEELVEEIKEVWTHLIGIDGRPHKESLPEMKILKGGVSFITDYVLALQLNYFSKLASRILIRLVEFRCKDLPKLYQRTQSLPWNQILKSSHFELHVTAKKSRLNNEKRISESIREAVLKTKFSSTNEPEDGTLPLIFVRNESDTVSISIDTSGELLYKRGWFNLKEKAPLRESSAHFILRKLINHENTDEIKLVDPMCGSGTFLLESLSFDRPNFTRQFGFYHLHICPKIFLSPSFSFNYKFKTRPLFAQLMGKDIDPKAISSCNANMSNFISQTKINEFSPILFEEQDLFSDSEVKGKNWIVCNPPYGNRLNQVGVVDKRRFPKVWLSQVLKVYSPLKIAFIYPTEFIDDFSDITQFGFNKNQRFSFKNGGIQMSLLIFSQPSFLK